MKFNKYIEKRKLTRKEVAEQLDVTIAIVGVWINGGIPGRKNVDEIEKWSDGKVNGASWYKK